MEAFTENYKGMKEERISLSMMAKSTTHSPLRRRRICCVVGIVLTVLFLTLMGTFVHFFIQVKQVYVAFGGTDSDVSHVLENGEVSLDFRSQELQVTAVLDQNRYSVPSSFHSVELVAGSCDIFAGTNTGSMAPSYIATVDLKQDLQLVSAFGSGTDNDITTPVSVDMLLNNPQSKNTGAMLMTSIEQLARPNVTSMIDMSCSVTIQASLFGKIPIQLLDSDTIFVKVSIEASRIYEAVKRVRCNSNNIN